MDNDIEKIRQRWRSLDIEAPAGAKAPGRSNGRLPHTEKQRIMVRLRLMALILIGAMLYYIIFMLEFHTPLWLNIYYEGFMVLAIGLFNCSICIPQIVGALAGGWILSLIGKPNALAPQDMMMVIAGISLIIGSFAVALIKDNDNRTITVE